MSTLSFSTGWIPNSFELFLASWQSGPVFTFKIYYAPEYTFLLIINTANFLAKGVDDLLSNILFRSIYKYTSFLSHSGAAS
ncbi:hypothetical protein JQN64_28630, partial [Escherichia coli]|nr:hypothetical protein [Escherichia coli]